MLKLGAKSAPAPAETPAEAPAEENPTDDTDLDFGSDDADDTAQDTASSDKPFDDEPFDAGVEADEESDPKKFIEQLTGKLGQSLRKYTEDQGEPDFELEKFAVNSLLSATHTGEMDPEDQKDIIKKVKKSGKGDENAGDETEDTGDEEPTDDETMGAGGEEPTGDETEDTGSEEEAPEDDSENMFETEMLDEMSLNDWKSRTLIKLYDDGDENIKHILTRMVSFNDNINREEFLKDLEEDFDNDDIQDVLKRLQELGIQLPKVDARLEESSIFLKNPPKNNMFQEGSNDNLDEYEIYEVVEEGKKKKKKTKKDACYHKVRARYDVWPSAYASGALVKCRKVGAANWGNKTNESEEKNSENLLNKIKGYKLFSIKDFNKKMAEKSIPMWKTEYENNLAKINELVARNFLYELAQELVGGVNEIDFVNEAKTPVNHFQMKMYLGDIILYTSPFIYVDNNHKVVSKRTQIEILNNDYDTIKKLMEVGAANWGNKSDESIEAKPLNEYYDTLQGYVMYGNKEKQQGSGFVEGDEVQYDYKNLKDEVIQTVDGVVDSVYGQPENIDKINSPIKNWVVVVQRPNGKLLVGTDTSSKKWGDIKDLRKKGQNESLDELRKKWSKKYKDSIDCNNPKGFSQKAHCQGRKKHD